MEIINSIFSWWMKKRIHQIDLFRKYPIEVQQELLDSLIKRGAQTEYGEKYGFSSIKNSKEFSERVPVVSYEQLYPYIEKVMKGQKNVLWPSEIKWFAKSSGTTNARSKFIPISEDSLEECHFKAGKDMLSIYFNNYEEAKMFTGKGLVIGGSQQVNQMDSNSRSKYGDLSAILISNMPWWAQIARTPSMEIALMDEWETKLEKMAKYVVNDNVTSMSGVPTWTLVLLEKLIKDHKLDNILELWPNLEVFFHGAVSFTPYEQLFKRLIPSEGMRYVETYNASEGFFGIQDQTDSKEMLLMLDYGIYYELVPLDEIGKENPKTLMLEEVEKDKVYAMLITTNSGLWRYNIGDTVKFTSINPFRIKIVGRTKHFINAFGEELMIENAETAIAHACEVTNAEIDNFTAGPVYLQAGKQGGHEWIIEFVNEPDDLDRFTTVLDEKLREINSDYDAKRHRDIALIAPKIHSVQQGVFHEWMKRRGKLGGQNKVPRLSNDREFLDDILEMLVEV